MSDVPPREKVCINPDCTGKNPVEKCQRVGDGGEMWEQPDGLRQVLSVSVMLVLVMWSVVLRTRHVERHDDAVGRRATPEAPPAGCGG